MHSISADRRSEAEESPEPLIAYAKPGSTALNEFAISTLSSQYQVLQKVCQNFHFHENLPVFLKKLNKNRIYGIFDCFFTLIGCVVSQIR